MSTHLPPENAPQPTGPPPKPSDAAQSVVPPTPWERASSTRRSQRSEAAGAKLEGGKRVARSGAGREKGDIKTGLYLIQDKYTDANSFTITDADLRKAAAEGVAEHRPFQLRISMPGWKLRVLTEDDYLYLLAAANADSH